MLPENALLLEGGEVLALQLDIVELGVAEGNVERNFVWVGELLVGFEVETNTLLYEFAAGFCRHVLACL